MGLLINPQLYRTYQLEYIAVLNLLVEVGNREQQRKKVEVYLALQKSNKSPI